MHPFLRLEPRPQVRPSASQESAPRPLRAPRAVKAQGATLSRPNWRQMALDIPAPPYTRGVA